LAQITLGMPSSKDGVNVASRIAAFERLSSLRGHRLLDFGCGSGVYTVKLAVGFDEVCGVDVEERRLDLARDRAVAAGRSIDFRLANSKLPWPDGHFDVVTMIEVLEHVADEELALSEIRRVLSADGRFFISVPNRLFPLELHSLRVRGRAVNPRMMPFLPWVPPAHSHFSEARSYTYRSIRMRLLSMGFAVSAPEYVMPGFESSTSLGRFVNPITSAVDRSALRCFGMCVLMVARPL
jgi:ubiquinone/menaquinone biosynthesis C-methylase UbiE